MLKCGLVLWQNEVWNKGKQWFDIIANIQVDMVACILVWGQKNTHNTILQSISVK